MIWRANALQEFFYNLTGFVYEHPDIFGISFDSRTITPGDMFFAMPGVNCDGHAFVQDAFAKGAACCVVSEFVPGCIIVPDVMDAFNKLASFRKNLLSCTVVGVTGSVGKTTTKFGLLHFFQKAGIRTFCAPKNYNNMLGVSYLYNCVPLDTQILIVEIGTNHPGEINSLASFVEPDYSIITHVGPAHIGNFYNLLGIVYEKADIIKHTKKCVFFNDDFWYAFSLKQIAMQSGVQYEVFHSGVGDDVALSTLKNAWKKLFQKLGVEFIDDDQFGSNIDGRRNIFDVNFNHAKLTIIDSAYNANLVSMIDAIKFVSANFANSSKIAILGEMKEVGKRAKRYHEVLSCYLTDFDVVLLVGEYMLHLANKMPEYKWFGTNAQLLEYIKQNINFDAAVLIKGSSSRLVDVVEFFKSSNKGS